MAVVWAGGRAQVGIELHRQRGESADQDLQRVGKSQAKGSTGGQGQVNWFRFATLPGL